MRLGPARPEISPEARMVIVGDYLVLFKVEGSEMTVVHGARDLGALFDIAVRVVAIGASASEKGFCHGQD